MRSFAALVPLFALLAGIGSFAASRTKPAPPPTDAAPRVKLAVLVVFDQMRGDYLARWRPLFGAAGFRRLTTEGAWFNDCHYPYGVTTTGPGHASILTGTCPDRHGIVNNNWNEKGEDVYCAGDARYALYAPAPPPAEPKSGAKPPPGGTPERLLSETAADVLKRTYGSNAKVFGLSLKDRSAILPTGRAPDGAYWFDGRVITSTYYTERLGRTYPDWAKRFVNPNRADRWFGHSWERFRPDVDYARFSGPDDSPGEGGGSEKGRSFPHPLGGVRFLEPAAFYNALANSPCGNDLLLDVAWECIAAEDLGGDSVPDLLVVSFSSNDLVGHTWGPDSQEVLDITLRTDALMADFLRFLDAKVGKDQYAVVLTADHGICPLPEVSVGKGRDARRVNRFVLQERTEQYLRSRFSKVQATAKSSWIEAVSFPWLYLNPRLVQASGRSREEVAAAVARFLVEPAQRELGVAEAFTRADLAPAVPPRSDVHQRMKRSFHPARCGDVGIVLAPLDVPSERKPNEILKVETGTTHGSPYDYDTHVPLIVFGPGIPGGARNEPVTPQAAAAIVSHFLRVPPPADAEYPVPASLFAR